MFLLYVFCHSMKSIENNRGPTAHTFPMRDHPSGQKLLLLIPVLSTMHCLHEKQLVDAQHRVVWHPTFRIPQIGLDVRILKVWWKLGTRTRTGDIKQAMMIIMNHENDIDDVEWSWWCWCLLWNILNNANTRHDVLIIRWCVQILQFMT